MNLFLEISGVVQYEICTQKIMKIHIYYKINYEYL